MSECLHRCPEALVAGQDLGEIRDSVSGVVFHACTAQHTMDFRSSLVSLEFRVVFVLGRACLKHTVINYLGKYGA